MQITLIMTVDLGEHGTTAEQLLDAGTLRRALVEAATWHGRVDGCEVRHLVAQGGYSRPLIDLDGLAQPYAQALSESSLHGVEWGGK